MFRVVLNCCQVGDGICNPGEAEIVRQLLHALLSTGVSPAAIGVTSPYKAQVALLQQQATAALEAAKANLEVSCALCYWMISQRHALRAQAPTPSSLKDAPVCPSFAHLLAGRPMVDC